MRINKKSKVRNKKPEVSIIVPMYNVEKLVLETIKCLKKNSCSMEVLLIDDGSKDLTVKNVSREISGDKRFKLIRKSNSGVSSTRNLGISLAKGKYIFFSDSDDLLSDYAIDKLLSAANTYKADFVYGGIKKFNSQKTWTTPIHDKYDLFSEGIKSITNNPELFFSLAPSAKLIKRNLIKYNTFPEDIHCAEDQIVVFNILTNAKKIYSIGEYIYFYRERDPDSTQKSITQQQDVKSFEYLQYIYTVMRIVRNNFKNNKQFSDTFSQKEILRQYYERALTFDVWSFFIRTLKHNPKHTKDAFNLTYMFLSEFDDSFFNYVAGFRYFFLRMLLDNLDYVRAQNFSDYRNLIQFIIDRLYPETKSACERYWGKRWNDVVYLSSASYFSSFKYFLKLRIKKRVCRFINQNQESIIKNYIFPIYRLFPIQKNKIVFATSTKGKASSNFTALLNELKKDKDTYNIKKFLGLSNEFKRNLSRFFHLATADTIILESYYKPLYGLTLNNKTKVIQVWHACGAFKKFGISAIGQEDSNSEEFEKEAHHSYTHVIASSEVTGKLYAEAFGTSMKKVYSFGVPRTDMFFSNYKKTKIQRNILEQYPDLDNTINILYSPTFRGKPSQRTRFKLPFELDIMDKLSKEYKLIIKLHPVVDITTINIPNKYKDRVILLPSNEDVNNWMIFSDILITDYSSLIFEYSLLNKPIVFYAPDFKEYFKERGFYFDYEEYTYGRIAKTSDDLVRAIETANEDMGLFEVKKSTFKSKFMSSCTGTSASKIVDVIIKD